MSETPPGPTGSPRREGPGPDEVRVASGRTWGADVAPLLRRAAAGSGPRESWVVRGAPGTGRTALITDVVRTALGAGVPAERVLVVVHDAAAGARLLEAATEGGGAVAGSDPMVRTVHSLAYGILRLSADRRELPPPRLLTGAEHDVILRETLRGEAEDGGGDWPVSLRPALTTVGFARELRDLMLRSVERELDLPGLRQLADEAGRPLWARAADFFLRHEQQMTLRSASHPEAEGAPPALNASELVGEARTALLDDPDLLASFRERAVFAVDDAHHLDPASAELLELLGAGAGLFVVTESPEQAVFRFRGADGLLASRSVERGARTVELARGHRMARSLSEVSATIAHPRPGDAAKRGSIAPPAVPGEGSVRVRVLSSSAAEAAEVADFLRRRHVLDGVPWSRMAVLARTLPLVADELLHALDAAGVPVVDAGAEIPPSHDPVVAALLAVLRSVLVEPDADAVLGLLSGPVGRADPVALRRLRRGIRRTGLDHGVERSAEVLRRLVIDDPAGSGPDAAGLTDVELAPVRRVREVRAATLRSWESGGTAEEVLWAAWHATGFAHRLVPAALTGDPWARQADRALDAVIVLFDHAADFVDQIPGGALGTFVDMVSGRDLPAPRRVDGRAPVEAVSVLSAHSAVGREWDAVAVCGVQDGVWPAPRRRSGLLGVDELVDITAIDRVAGALPPVGEREAIAAAERAEEERRLFRVACSRARSHLLVTAVEALDSSGDRAASRFVSEIAGADTGSDRGERSRSAPRVLSLPHLVADLRTAAAAGGDDSAYAAGLLATLAEEGVEEADPAGWYGVADPTGSLEPVPAEGAEVTLSPSSFGSLEECPLQWFLGRLGGDPGSTHHLLRGSFLHAVAQAVAGGVPASALETAVRRHWPRLTRSRGVFVQREVDELLVAVEVLREWQTSTRGGYTLAGVEVPFSFTVAPTGTDTPTVTLRGRIDRLETVTSDESVAVVDLKTSATKATRAEGQANPQLAVYQLAIREGAVDGMDGATTGGGFLLYPALRGAAKAAPLPQDPLTDEAADLLRERIGAAARDQLGPAYVARPGPACERCAVAACCPAVPSGEQVTS